MVGGLIGAILGVAGSYLAYFLFGFVGQLFYTAALVTAAILSFRLLR